MEVQKESGLELDWYFEYWINTNEVVDYAIGHVVDGGNATYLELRRKGNMPMPIEVLVTYVGGRKQLLYLPLGLMYGDKKEFANLLHDRKL